MDKKRITKPELIRRVAMLRGELERARRTIAHHRETADSGKPCLSCQGQLLNIDDVLRWTA